MRVKEYIARYATFVRGGKTIKSVLSANSLGLAWGVPRCNTSGFERKAPDLVGKDEKQSRLESSPKCVTIVSRRIRPRRNLSFLCALSGVHMLVNINEGAVIAQLVERMAEYGILVDPAELRDKADGNLHRVHAAGDARGTKKAWFTLHLDGRPAGSFGHHSKFSGETFFFRFNGEVAPETAAQRREREEKSALEKAAKAEERRQKAEKAERTAKRAKATLEQYDADKHAVLNGYLEHKVIGDAPDVLFDSAGVSTFGIPNALVVPMQDLDGRVWSLQGIFRDANNFLGRDRSYLPGTLKDGLHFPIGEVQQRDGADVYVVCEGLATGLQINRATNHRVLVAFDAGNLVHVARALRDRHPDATILIAGDNDRWKDPARNPGLTSMFDVMSAVGGWGVWPPYMEDAGAADEAGKLRGPTDFDDWVREHGAESARDIFEAVIEQVTVAKHKAKAEARAAMRKAQRPVAPSVEQTREVVELPVIVKPWTLPKVEIKSAPLSKHLDQLLDYARRDDLSEADRLHVAALAWTICLKHSASIPVKLDSIEKLMAEIRWTNAPLHSATFAAISAAIEKLVAKRKRAALAHVSISDDVLARHEYIQCDEIPVLTDADERAVLWMPMASGKTKHVLKPFAERFHARINATGDGEQGANGSFLAVSPRVALVHDLASTLGEDLPAGTLAHYQHVDNNSAFAVDMLATCLPSVTKANHASIIDRCTDLAVDEFTAQMAFVPSTMCSTKDGNNKDVYFKLLDLISSSQRFIVADADMNDRAIEFLEARIPADKKLKIFHMPKTQHGMKVRFGHDGRDFRIALAEAAALLDEGKAIVFACETVDLAKDVDLYLRGEHPTKRIIKIDGDNSTMPEQEKFLANADAESRNWDAVIHTPVIGSGISITHKVRKPETGELECVPHFAKVFFAGNGHAIKPSDAFQMMRRVRYVTEFTAVTRTNNRTGGIQDVDSALGALEDGTLLEHRPDEGNAEGDENQFNRFFVAEKLDAKHAKLARFAAALRWIMEYDGFVLTRIHQTEQQADQMTLEELGAEYDEKVKKVIIAARDLSKDEYDSTNMVGAKNEAELAELRRYRILSRLGGKALDHADVWDAWNGGSGVSVIDQFIAAIDGRADTRNSAVLLAHRTFNAARVRGFRYLFDGLATSVEMIRPGMVFTQSMADEIVGRAVAKREMLAAIGVIPESMGEGATYTPPEGSMKLALTFFRRMGLKFDRIDPARGIYQMTDSSFAFMRRWADMRQQAIGMVPRDIEPLAPVVPTTLEQAVCDALHHFGGGDLPAAITLEMVAARVNAGWDEADHVTTAKLAKPMRAAGMVKRAARLKVGKVAVWVWVQANTNPDNSAAHKFLASAAAVGAGKPVPLLHISPVSNAYIEIAPKCKSGTTLEEQVSDPARVDAYILSDDEFWAMDMPVPEEDEIDLMAIAATRE